MQNMEGSRLTGKVDRPTGEVWVGLGWVAFILERHVIRSVLKGQSPNSHQNRCWKYSNRQHGEEMREEEVEKIYDSNT
jgi:hypothetical protein